MRSPDAQQPASLLSRVLNKAASIVSWIDSLLWRKKGDTNRVDTHSTSKPLRDIIETLRKGDSIRPDTLSAFKLEVSTLPDGPHKTIFTEFLQGLEKMEEDERRQVLEERVPDDVKILDKTRTNEDVLLLLRGAVDIEFPQGKLRLPAPGILGETSVIATKGKVTVDVTAVSDCLIVRIPKTKFYRLCEDHPALKDAVEKLIEERAKQALARAALGDGLNAAQLLAQIYAVNQQAGVDSKSILSDVEQLAERAPEIFYLERVAPGHKLAKQGSSLNSAIIVLEGEASFLAHGAVIGTLSVGDQIFPDQTGLSPFTYVAKSPMLILRIQSHGFLALREKVDEKIKRRLEEQLAKRPNLASHSFGLENVGLDEIGAIYKAARDAGQFIPKRRSGNVFFECGSRAEVLCWLGIRGQLSHMDSLGWRVAGETADGNFLLQRMADAPIMVARSELEDENLDPAIDRLVDVKNAMATFIDKCGLGFAEAAFLVEQGIVPIEIHNALQLETFKNSFNRIREAIFVIRQWVGTPPNGAKRTLIGRILIRLLIETTHHMGITTLMKDPHTQPMVLQCLDDMLALPTVNTAQFAEFVDNHTGPLRDKFEADQSRWNIRERTPRSIEFREFLLKDEPWKEVYAIASSDLTLQQSQQLQNYIEMLDTEICPSFVSELESIFLPIHSADDVMPLVTGRTKDWEGVVNKLRRKQTGFKGREADNSYCLADMPDVVGARVIVRNIAKLEQAMEIIENRFGDHVYEKDDFYGNPIKQSRRPYRLVTYTVQYCGVPVEIQLQTLPSAIAAALDHDTIYKPYVPTSLKGLELIDQLSRSLAVAESKQRMQPESPAQPRIETALPGEWKKPAMRHIFQASGPVGKCPCAYVSADFPLWDEDFEAASYYFRWQEANGFKVYLHHGASAIDASACKGLTQWRDFRAGTIRRLTEQLKHQGTVGVIEDLEKQGAPLFVLEAFADDLDYQGNRTAFLNEIKVRYDPNDYDSILRSLAIATEAHGNAGQSYAIEKLHMEGKDLGKPKYPSSLALKHIPYVNHCIQTARLAARCGLTADAIQAMLCHDVLEDTTMTAADLGNRVSAEALRMIESVTKLPDESRQGYMARVKLLTGESKIIKALDREHNLLRAFNLRDSKSYLDRIVTESHDVFEGEFAPNAALFKEAMRFQMLLEAVDRFRRGKSRSAG